MIRKWDVALIVSLLILSCIPAALFWASGQAASANGTHAIIYVDGKEYRTIPLSEHHGTDTLTIRTSSGSAMKKLPSSMPIALTRYASTKDF